MPQKTLRQWLVGDLSVVRILASLAFIYISLGVFAYFFADRLIFQPQPSSYQQTPDLLKLRTADDVNIAAVHLPNPVATYTILYSHGNGEDLGDVRPALEEIRNIGFAVFAYDYRGYGTSEGTPSEQGAYKDIDAAYAYLTQQLKIPPDRIILYGRSVGSGPSVDLATRQPSAGLILESPFTSTFVVMTRIPLYPFDRFPNLSKISSVRVPVLILHGTNDRTIPLSHGKRLFQAANEPKRSLWVEGADHNDVMLIAGAQYPKALREFTQLIGQHKN